jgi:hypothetical protein
VSISKRVNAAFKAMLEGDAEDAFFEICAAAEATSRAESGTKGKSSFKSWVTRNVPLVAAAAIGPALAGIRIAYSHPELKPTPDGTHDLAELIYHVVRCGFYHDAELPSNVTLTDNVIGGGPNGELKLPKNLVLGLIVAVVASPCNSKMSIPLNYYFTVHGVRFTLAACRGARDALVKQLSALYEKNRVGKAP